MISRGGALWNQERRGGASPNLERRGAPSPNLERGLLDQERKEELILAKQVRQGTVVILGGNQIRDSSPFIHFDQTSRSKPKKKHPVLSSPPPAPNPESIRKASNPIALRYWNQCVQTSAAASPPPSPQSSPSPSSPSSPTTQTGPKSPGPVRPPRTTSQQVQPVQPANNCIQKQPNQPAESNYDIPPPPRPKPPTHYILADPGIKPCSSLQPLDIPPPWEQPNYSIKPLLPALVPHEPRRTERRRETRKTFVIKAQTGPQARSSSLPPWSRGTSSQWDGCREVSPASPALLTRCQPNQPNQCRSTVRKPGWIKESSPTPVYTQFLNRGGSPSPAQPCSSPATRYRLRTPWLQNQENQVFCYPETNHQPKFFMQRNIVA